MGRPRNRCGTCGYAWFPRGHNLSAACPRCKGGLVVAEIPPPTNWAPLVIALAVLVLVPFAGCVGCLAIATLSGSTTHAPPRPAARPARMR